MKKRYYSFAGLNLQVELPDDTEFTEGRYLQPFRGENGTQTNCVCFSLADELDPPNGEMIYSDSNVLAYSDRLSTVRYYLNADHTWENAFSRVESNGNHHRVQLKTGTFARRINGNVILNSLGIEHLIASCGGFAFHCSYIEYHGKAILFTAPSQTGKSTQADLWHDLRGAQIINGDRAAVRLVNGELLVCGIPFAGSSQYCENRSLPISAIVYLGQAPETTIRRVRGYEAFAKIWEGVSVNPWDKADMEIVSAVVEAAAGKLPVFHLLCTPDESAVIALEDALRKLEFV